MNGKFWLEFTFFYFLCRLVTGSNSSGQGSFVTSLIKILDDSENKDTSWVISPVSVRSILEELYLGSDGDSRNQIGSTLSISNKSQIVEEQSRLRVNANSGVSWKTANRIVVKDSFPLNPSYQSEITNIFQSDVVSDDFKSPRKSASSINSWISDHTDGFINNLVTADDITQNTVLITINAVFFNGTWKYSFPTNMTKQRCFYSRPGYCHKVDMMELDNAKLKYGQNDELDAQIVQLPYNDTMYSMVLLVPNKYDGISKVINKLSLGQLLEFIKNMNDSKVDALIIPKFTNTFHIDLTSTLEKVGISSIFNSHKANFSAMSNVTGISVSKLVHEAYIAVTESGTVAAASTVSGIHRNVVGPKILINADHPFIYFIVLNNSDVLFTGQYVN